MAEQMVTMKVGEETFEVPFSVVLSTYADIMYFAPWYVYKFVQEDGGTKYQIKNGCHVAFYEDEQKAQAGSMLYVMNTILNGEDDWHIKVSKPVKLTDLFASLLSGTTDVS